MGLVAVARLRIRSWCGAGDELEAGLGGGEDGGAVGHCC